MHLDLAGQLYRPAKPQQILGRGGLAGVRVRNDPECSTDLGQEKGPDCVKFEYVKYLMKS